MRKFAPTSLPVEGPRHEYIEPAQPDIPLDVQVRDWLTIPWQQIPSSSYDTRAPKSMRVLVAHRVIRDTFTINVTDPSAFIDPREDRWEAPSWGECLVPFPVRSSYELMEHDVELEQMTTEPATLGEGPCWHPADQVLYWVDIWGKSLHRFDPATRQDHQWDIGQRIGTVVPRAQGGLLLALQDGLAFFDPESGTQEPWEPIDEHPETRFNDGKCDPSGRFWVGSMDNVREERPLGTLYRVDLDGSVHAMIRGVTISNGLAWSPDASTMYYIDSPTKQVVAYDFDAESGAISKRRTVITLNEEQGYPDGMTIDVEGKIWLAHWAGQRICRWDPATGEVLRTYPTPAPHTSCCCFGGAGMNELFITTARKGLDAEQLNQFPLSGHVFRLTTDVVGAPSYAYGG